MYNKYSMQLQAVSLLLIVVNVINDDVFFFKLAVAEKGPCIPKKLS